MRVIVDEGVSQTSPLWQQFQTWLGTDSAEGLWLADVYPSIPDVEILDKLLTPDTVLLTRDGVLHNRALSQGVQSFTLNAQGQLTRTKLPLDTRTRRPQAPSILKALKTTYQHVPHPIALTLSAELPPKVLKAYRTRRRRIRSYVGSVDNLATVAWTIGARRHQDHLLCGYVMHIEGRQGVKGLRASEAYGIDPSLPPDPAQCLVHALCDLFQLHLEHVKHELFVIPTDVYELARQVVAHQLPASAPPVQRALSQILGALPEVVVSPCVKGRFYSQMQRKLYQLTTSPTNEIVSLDFSDIMRRLGGSGV